MRSAKRVGLPGRAAAAVLRRGRNRSAARRATIAGLRAGGSRFPREKAVSYAWRGYLTHRGAGRGRRWRCGCSALARRLSMPGRSPACTQPHGTRGRRVLRRKRRHSRRRCRLCLHARLTATAPHVACNNAAPPRLHRACQCYRVPLAPTCAEAVDTRDAGLATSLDGGAIETRRWRNRNASVAQARGGECGPPQLRPQRLGNRFRQSKEAQDGGLWDCGSILRRTCGSVYSNLRPARLQPSAASCGPIAAASGPIAAPRVLLRPDCSHRGTCKPHALPSTGVCSPRWPPAADSWQTARP